MKRVGETHGVRLVERHTRAALLAQRAATLARLAVVLAVLSSASGCPAPMAPPPPRDAGCEPIVASGEVYDEVVVGSPRVCARTSSGTVRCWTHRTDPRARGWVHGGEYRPCAEQSSVGLAFGPLGRLYSLDRSGRVTSFDFADSRAEPVTGLSRVVELRGSGEVLCARHDDATVGCISDPGRLPWMPPSTRAIDRYDYLHFAEPAGVTAFAVNHSALCVIAAGMRAYCIGQSLGPQALDRLSPIDGVDGAVQVTTSGLNTCFRRASGPAACFGVGWEGFGTGVYPPRDVADTDGCSDIAMEAFNGCMVRSSGRIACMGWNFAGTLGDGTRSSRFQFADISEPTGFVDVEAGSHIVCGRTRERTLYCWGRSLAPRDRAPRETARAVASGASSVAVGGDSSCAVDTSGAISCWGDNSAGQFGDGTRVDHATPTRLTSWSPVRRVAIGLDFMCGVSLQGDVDCAGANERGQLGVGDQENRVSPTRVALRDVTDLRAAGLHACAMVADGSAWCWGSNREGQLLRQGPSGGGIAFSAVPLRVSGTRRVTRLSVGVFNTCVRFEDGTWDCSGSFSSPTAPPIAANVVDVAWSGRYRCTLAVGGTLQCVDGRQTLTRDVPGAVALTTTAADLCWVTDRGTAHCSHQSLETFFGGSLDGVTDADVPGSAEIAGGTQHACVRTNTGAIHCFGAVDLGQIGDGSYAFDPLPVRMSW